VPALIDLAATRRSEPRVAAECLLLAASIELARAASESLTPPPPIPAELAGPYHDALARAAALTADAEAAQPGLNVREMLAICGAVFAGDLMRARRLVDGPEEDEATA
jgi:hypothetical protein